MGWKSKSQTSLPGSGVDSPVRSLLEWPTAGVDSPGVADDVTGNYQSGGLFLRRLFFRIILFFRSIIDTGSAEDKFGRWAVAIKLIRYLQPEAISAHEASAGELDD